MQGNRTLSQTKKSRIILNRRFSIISDMNAGDSGQLIIDGVIEKEALDDFDNYIKTINITSAVKIETNAKRK